MTPPLHSANARRMASLLRAPGDAAKTASWLIGQGVQNPRETAGVLARAGYLVHVEDSAWELGVRYTLVGRQGELALA